MTLAIAAAVLVAVVAFSGLCLWLAEWTPGRPDDRLPPDSSWHWESRSGGDEIPPPPETIDATKWGRR